MTLFFYGAIALEGDELEIRRVLLQSAQDLGWTLSLNALQEEFSFEELFGFTDDQDWLVFELLDTRNQDPDADDPIYRSYGGEDMVAQYQAAARQIGIDEADTIEFGDSPLVDEAYRNYPADLPVILFFRAIRSAFPSRVLILSFDQDFENRIHCHDIIGDDTTLIKAIWLTIAFGYTCPNLRLKTPPMLS